MSNNPKRKKIIIGVVVVFVLLFILSRGGEDRPGINTRDGVENRAEKTLAAGAHVEGLMHDGGARWYEVHVPVEVSEGEPLPVVLVFHGGGSNIEQVKRQSGFDTKAMEEGFIAVFPLGVGKKFFGVHMGTWNAGKCCGIAHEEEVDDVGFVRALVDDLETKTLIDRDRIYATGLSNGALISFRLACDAADLIAAVAPLQHMMHTMSVLLKKTWRCCIFMAPQILACRMKEERSAVLRLSLNAVQLKNM